MQAKLHERRLSIAHHSAGRAASILASFLIPPFALKEGIFVLTPLV
jgi:hypothetical protein